MGDIKKKVNIGVDDTHVIKLANSIIKDAFKSRASDIHIEWLRKQAIESGMITLREDGIDNTRVSGL